MVEEEAHRSAPAEPATAEAAPFAPSERPGAVEHAETRPDAGSPTADRAPAGHAVPGALEHPEAPGDGAPRPASTPSGDGAALGRAHDADGGLLPTDQGDDLRRRWEQVQAAFVDEPRTAVERADALVGEVTELVARRFAEERARLEGHWSSGGAPDTEELRIALRRYRALFEVLLRR